MKKFSKIISMLCAMAVIATGSYASAMGKDKNKMSSGVSESEIQKHAYDRSAVIGFDSGSASLSESDKTKIRDLVSKVGLDNVSRIEVAAWSDKAFPKTGADLPKADQNLADQRITNIKNYLKDDLNVSAMRITSYNMAETSNWLARTFRTDEAELKSVFAKEATAPMARADFNVIAREGAPSKAILVLVRK